MEEYFNDDPEGKIMGTIESMRNDASKYSNIIEK